MANATTPLSFKIPPRGFEELSLLAAHADRLPEVLAVAQNFPLTASDGDLSHGVSEQTKIPVDEVSPLLTGVATLHNLGKRTGTNYDELLKAIIKTLAVEAPEEWRKRSLEKLQLSCDRIAQSIESMTEDHPLLMRQKATELTFAHQNIFKSSRIIIDLRPVFNSVGDEIKAIVLTHVLGVEYFDGVRNQRIEFALDEGDVQAMLESAQRAIDKTGTTRKAMAGHWELIVAGVTADDASKT